MFIKTICSLVAAVFVLTISVTDASADTMRKILERGKIVIGVKADYRPWGYRDTNGDVIGLEIDLAEDVAKRLGVELEKVVVVGSNRMEFLNQGKIALIIATMGDNLKRRRVVGMIEPDYYAGGANLIARKTMGFKQWSEIKGKKICTIQGAYYNERVTKLYAPVLMAFKGVPEIEKVLRNGDCAAFLYDSTWIESNLANGDWDGYEMPLETEDPSLWALGVRLDDLSKPFGLFISGLVYDWHKNGKLLELERKWGIKNSPYLIEMNKQLNN